MPKRKVRKTSKEYVLVNTKFLNYVGGIVEGFKSLTETTNVHLSRLRSEGEMTRRGHESMKRLNPLARNIVNQFEGMEKTLTYPTKSDMRIIQANILNWRT